MSINFTSKGYFSHISQFIQIKQIGIGSFGKVLLCLHIQTNKFYALKIVQLNEQQNQKQSLLLQRQIYIHSNVDHPHIVKLWDVFSDKNHIYLVIQLAENSTLFSFQNKVKLLSEVEAFKYFNQTLKAIEYLHSVDIMHRDIKPENILLDKNNNVKLCDLGWATENIHMKRKTFCGTYEYMAPEMIFQKQYNYKIDIWALGILLYELTHGYAPFQAKSLAEIRQKITQGCYQINQTCSDQLKSLIVDLLQFDPDQRPELSQLKSNPWIQKMKKQIQTHVLSFKNGVNITDQSIQQSRVKSTVNRKQIAYESLNKNHKKIQSYDKNQHDSNSKHQNLQIKSNLKTFKKILQTDQAQSIKRLKKKCKTQGQESIQKFYTQKVAKPTSATINFKKKSDKENNNNLSRTFFSKLSNFPEYTSSFNLTKNQPKSVTRVKKAHDVSSKRQKNQKKVSRLKTINFF